MAEVKLYDSNQLELIGGEIVNAPERPRYYMSEKAIAQRIAASKAAAATKHRNTERAQFTLACIELSKGVNREDPDSLLQAFYNYIELAEEMGERVSNMTAYAAMGVTRSNIDDWYTGATRKGDPRYKELATFVKSVCAAYREQLGMDGAIHPALTIFWQRNYDGLTNEDIVRVETTNPLGEIHDAKQIAEKYKNIPED